jgi:cellobiose-specific phosphotransferase system component IIB
LSILLRNLNEILSYKSEEIDIDEYWNMEDNPALKMHSIHAYPAKFPAFIATKAINYARMQGVNIRHVADIFCGCGTVALEAKINNIDFWGCDINPVATLIAKVKSETFSVKTLNKYYNLIIQDYNNRSTNDMQYSVANDRLVYWFDKAHYLDLYKLLAAIESISNKKYKQAFKCIFSSILKPTSRWLTKSIKPQIDPKKIPVGVIDAFRSQFSKFVKAVEERNINSNASIKIEKMNFLKKQKLPNVSLIITSPPYVTSYEYADLHQLSSLWLGYTDNYQTLRRGTIGSIHNSEEYYCEIMDLNTVGRNIVQQMRDNQIPNAKIKSVARYYIDMQKTISKCYTMLEDGGMTFFIVGDTEYKGVKIENSRHLAESLSDSGFYEVTISKRKISNKLLTPYRDEIGRFTTNKNERKVYHEEFIIIGKKAQ